MHLYDLVRKVVESNAENKNAKNALKYAFEAEDFYRKKLWGDDVTKSYKVMASVVKYIYDVNDFVVINHKTESKNTPEIVDSDYMWHDSDFARWIRDRNIMDACNNLRDARNGKKGFNAQHSREAIREATEEDAYEYIYKAYMVISGVALRLEKLSAQERNDLLKAYTKEYIKEISVLYKGAELQNRGLKHVACVLLLDTSESMGWGKNDKGNRPIDELNQALAEFKKASEKSKHRGRIEVSVISFNNLIEQVQEFDVVDRWSPIELEAAGRTYLNAGIEKALDVIANQKAFYKSKHVKYFRPWLFVMSDGKPSKEDMESYEDTCARIRSTITNKGLIYYPVAVGTEADQKLLASYYPEDYNNRSVIVATNSDSDRFEKIFEWLSNSIDASIDTNENPEEQGLFQPIPAGMQVKSL